MLMINLRNLLKRFNSKKNISAAKNIIVSAYEEFLKRRPSEDEISSWLEQIINSKISYKEFFNAVANSDEIRNSALTKNINALYGNIANDLIKTAKDIRLDTERIIEEAAGKTAKDIRSDAEESIGRDIIISAYEEFLNRKPSESEIKYWLESLTVSKIPYRDFFNAIVNAAYNPENFKNSNSNTVSNTAPDLYLERIIKKPLNPELINEIKKIETSEQLISNRDLFALKYALFKDNLTRHTDKKIIYFHIPKCAGNSVMKYFEYAFGSGNILRFNVNGFLPDEDGDKWINEWNALFDYAEFISIAHCGFKTCRKIPGDNRIIAFFREPKSRILSSYYYFRSHRASHISSLPKNRRDAVVLSTAKTDNLINFLKNKNPYVLNNIDNTVTRCLTGFFLKYDENAPDSNYDKLHEEHEKTIEIALKNLDEIDLIGIMENFDASLKFISKTLALKEPEENSYKENVTEKNYGESSFFEKIEKEPLTEEIEKELEKFTELDKIIYAYALKKFDNQIKLS
ncbi:MAG: sulfotransferase family 2 domain-containing protein [Deltaproteobacteria bacterium]|jgi:hypothetical protein|nr:sulfotransferase family 2 domain-containing protein [Deltaproteobacteria bacterium]